MHTSCSTTTAIDLATALGDEHALAHTHTTFSLLYDADSNNTEALHHIEQASSYFRTADQPAWYAETLNAAGWHYGQLGDQAAALKYSEEALALQRTIKPPVSTADTLDTVGYAHHRLGDFEKAIGCCQQAGDPTGHHRVDDRCDHRRDADEPLARPVAPARARGSSRAVPGR
jgi:tetratricopeptide (TPR) repeat protein